MHLNFLDVSITVDCCKGIYIYVCIYIYIEGWVQFTSSVTLTYVTPLYFFIFFIFIICEF